MSDITTTTPPQNNKFNIGALLAYLLPVAIGCFILACGWGAFKLGELFKLDFVYAAFIAVGSVVLTLAHAGSIVKSDSNSQRLLHGLGLLIWLVLLLFFGAVYFGATSAGVAVGMSEEVITATLAKSFLPAEVLDAGRAFYAYAPAIGLTTALVTAVVSFAMSHPIKDLIHKTLGESFAPMALNLVTGLIVTTSALHVLQYGLQFAGVGGFEALAACIVAELTFIASEQMALKEIKARSKSDSFDVFDLIAWAILAIVALGYMILINRVYGQMAELIAAGKTLALAHEATNEGLYGQAKALYSVSAPIFGGLLVMLKVITTFVNVRSGQKITLPTPPQYNIRKPATAFAKTTTGQPELAAPTVTDNSGTDNKTVTVKKPNMRTLRAVPRGTDNKTCAECGGTFNSSRADAKYCSGSCRKKAARRRDGTDK
jgi:hypothetical protein